jgi:hypothetical protein
MKPMTRRQIMLPDDLWEAAVRYAADHSVKTGEPVSTAKAIRRLLRIGLEREGRKV